MDSMSRSLRSFAIVCAALSAGPANAQVGSYYNDLNANIGDAFLLGSAALNAGSVRLTLEGAGVQSAGYVMNSVGTVETFSASFDLFFNADTDDAADGIAFSLGVWPDTLVTNIYDERGADQGLSVSFDWYEGFPLNPRIIVRFNGSELASVPSIISLANDEGFFRRATVELDALGRVTVTYNGTIVVDQLATAFVPNPNYRFGFSSRTQGLDATQRVDDISITACLLSDNTWTEVGDAGRDGIDEAQLTFGAGPLTSIVGNITGNADVDVYCIRITDEAAFTASTVGGAAFDTVLYLFDVAGNGLVFNDDSLGAQSTIDSTLVLSNGVYFLAISSFGVAADSPATRARDENDQPIFSYPSPGQTPVNACGGALRPSCNAISGRLSFWSSGGGSNGAYTIALTGADFCAPRCPTTHRVPEQFATIQAAINAAVDGDTVLVGPGLYQETLIIQKNISIRSERGPKETIVDGNGARAVEFWGNTGPNCILEGFTLFESTGSSAGVGQGTHVFAGAPLLRNIIYPDCQQNAAWVQGGSATIFDRCQFVDGSVNSQVMVIGSAGNTAARFSNCLFARNAGTETLFAQDATVELYNCTFADNTAPAIWATGTAAYSGAQNIIWDNPGGDIFGLNPNTSFTGSVFASATGANFNTNADPRFESVASGNYRLGAGSPAIDRSACNAFGPNTLSVTKATSRLTLHDLDGACRVVDASNYANSGVGCPAGFIDAGCYEAEASAALTAPFCAGDANGDAIVDFQDINAVIANWLLTCP